MRRFLAGLFASLVFASPSLARAEAPATCAVEKYVGISEDDARAVEEVVCTEVRAARPYAASHRIRVVQLGSKIVLTLASDGAGDKQLVLSSLEEVAVAAPRLVSASAEQKVVSETQDVTNIVGLEARTPKKKASEVHGWLGAAGVASIGEGPLATGGGMSLGISAGSEIWSFVGDFRAAGGRMGVVAFTGGVRHHFGTSDATPFAGVGMGILHVSPKDFEGGSGLGFYTEVGLDLLRTNRFGGAITMRLDLPAFALEDKRYAGYPDYRTTTETRYVPVFMSGIALRF